MNQPVCREGVFSQSTKSQVRGTLALLGYYRRIATGRLIEETARQEASRRLQQWQAEAILRKVGLSPPLNHRGQPCRKWDSMEQVRMVRDCYRVRDRATKRVRVYQFETEEVRRRFGHLLSRYDD